jgi:hypothetical protein
VTLRLDPSLPEGYEVSEVVTFDPTPALKLLREHLPTAAFAVEEVGRGYRLTAPFPPGELDGDEVIVAFERLLDAPASRVIVRSPEHTSADFLALTEELGLHGVNYFVGWTAWLDLAPAGVSKASALEQVRQRLGVDPVATMAVGDGRNDLEMFSWAARSVAMGNSEPDVKSAADEVTGQRGGRRGGRRPARAAERRPALRRRPRGDRRAGRHGRRLPGCGQAARYCRNNPDSSGAA